MDFIITQRHGILEDGVPFLQNDFFVASTRLGGYQFFEFSDSVRWVALDANFLSKSIIHNNFNHSLNLIDDKREIILAVRKSGHERGGLWSSYPEKVSHSQHDAV